MGRRWSPIPQAVDGQSEGTRAKRGRLTSVKFYIFFPLLSVACLVFIAQTDFPQPPGDVEIVNAVIPPRSPPPRWRLPPHGWPPVYWIDATGCPQLGNETILMLQKFNVNAIRIARRLPADVKRHFVDGTLKMLTPSLIIDDHVDSIQVHRTKNQYTYAEVALSLTHLVAIRTAFLQNYSIALIIEDGIDIFQEFPGRLPVLIANAPAKWEILQLAVNDAVALRHVSRIRDPIISWQFDFRGTGAYLINRNGMSKIINQFHPEQNHFIFPTSPVTDWWLYSSCNSFTSTQSVSAARVPSQYSVDCKDAGSTDVLKQLRQASLRQRDPYMKIMNLRALPTDNLLRNTTYVAVTTIHGNETSEKISKIIQLLKGNFLELRRFSVHWRVFVVLFSSLKYQKHGATHEEWHRRLEAEFDYSEFQVFFRYWDHAIALYSKWVFYSEIKEELKNYNFVIMHDNDMDMDGYPWQEFFRRHVAQNGKALITGITRESIQPDWLSTENMKDAYFSFLDKRWWRSCGREEVEWLPIEYVDQWFTVIDSSYLLWVFDQILAPVHEYLKNDGWAEGNTPDLLSSLGPDLVWCRTAKNHNGQCVLFPLTMRHVDWNTGDVDIDPTSIGAPIKYAYRWLFGSSWIRPHLATLFADQKCSTWRSQCHGEDKKYYYASEEIGSLPSCANQSKATQPALRRDNPSKNSVVIKPAARAEIKFRPKKNKKQEDGAEWKPPSNMFKRMFR